MNYLLSYVLASAFYFVREWTNIYVLRGMVGYKSLGFSRSFCKSTRFECLVGTRVSLPKNFELQGFKLGAIIRAGFYLVNWQVFAPFS